MDRRYFVYILASKPRGTLYVGMTNDLVRRVWEHRQGAVESFTRRYGVHRLVWFEIHDTVETAAHRERRTKHWLRDWKLNLVEHSNPHWSDLYDSIASP